MTQTTLDQLTDLTGYARCECGSTDIRAQTVPREMVVWCGGCGAKTTYRMTADEYGRKVVEVIEDGE